MAAVDFPNSPTTNQVFTSGALSYQWDGAKWASGSMSGFAPVTNPTSGQNNYAPIASPTFTGTVTIPAGASIAGYAPIPNPIGGASNYAPIASPTFTGTVSGAAATFTGTVTTPASVDTSTQATFSMPIVVNLSGTTTGSFYIGTSLTTPLLYISATSSSSNIANGAYLNTAGTAWVASATAASIIAQASSSGSLNFYADTGLTVGNTYSPNNRFQIAATGVTSNPPFNPSGGIIGKTDGSNAAAGQVGEYLQNYTSAPGSAVSLNGWNVIVSISVSAGDWDVEGNVYWQPSSGVAANAVYGCISTISTGASDQYSLLNFGASTYALGGLQAMVVPYTRVTTSATATVYLNIFVGQSTGTCTAAGSIRARRVR